jgi:hypothetical protein
MVLKKKTRYNHNKKSHLTKRRLNKNSNRRTRKLNKQSGGGDDFEIYYKMPAFSKNIYANSIGLTDNNYSGQLVNINYKKLSELPEVKPKTNGYFKLDFYYKAYPKAQTTQTTSETHFATKEISRTTTLFIPTVTPGKENTNNNMNVLINTFANGTSFVAVTIIIKISKKNKKGDTAYLSAHEKMYFNLMPMPTK